MSLLLAFTSINLSAKPLGEFEASFNKGDPVHEMLTSHTLNKYKPNVYMEDNFDNYLPSTYEYIRGVIWNDDPQALVFDKSKLNNRDFGTSKGWIKEYCGAQRIILKSGKPIFKAQDLIKRSHFGDLQFLHAMASSNGEAADITKREIYQWLNFLYVIIESDNINEKTKISEINHTFVNDYFYEIKELTLQELFGGKGYWFINIKKRALGSFLHVIQDSYFPGHVSRKNNYNEITQFLNYSNQDGTKHGDTDTWDASFLDRVIRSNSYLVKTLPQYDRVITVSVELLKRLEKKDNWSLVEQYLDDEVFKMEDPKSSSAGDGFISTKKKSIPAVCHIF